MMTKSFAWQTAGSFCFLVLTISPSIYLLFVCIYIYTYMCVYCQKTPRAMVTNKIVSGFIDDDYFITLVWQKAGSFHLFSSSRIPFFFFFCKETIPRATLKKLGSSFRDSDYL